MMMILPRVGGRAVGARAPGPLELEWMWSERVDKKKEIALLRKRGIRHKLFICWWCCLFNSKQHRFL